MVKLLKDPKYLEKILIQFIERIDDNYQDLRTEDFSDLSIKPAMFVVFLHSALESFLRICFKKLIKDSLIKSAEAKEQLINRLEKFDLNTDFSLYTSLFLPECYDNSEIRKIIINKRNAYAHRIIDKFGNYIFQKDEKYRLEQENIKAYLNYTKELMKKLVQAVDKNVQLS